MVKKGSCKFKNTRKRVKKGQICHIDRNQKSIKNNLATKISTCTFFFWHHVTKINTKNNFLNNFSFIFKVVQQEEYHISCIDLNATIWTTPTWPSTVTFVCVNLSMKETADYVAVVASNPRPQEPKWNLGGVTGSILLRKIRKLFEGPNLRSPFPLTTLMRPWESNVWLAPGITV